MNQWRRTSDAFGRLTNVAELGSSSHPLNLQTNYTYDGFGNLLNVNQNGQSGDTPRQQRSFTYDALSRLVCASNPENSTAACPSSAGTYVAGTTGYNYYASGGALCAGDHSLPCSKTDARGVTTNYAYDSLNRLLSKTFTNAPAGSMSSCFAYDTATNGIGKLAAEWTQKGTCPGVAPASGGFQTMRIFQQYDAMGHVTNELQCTPNASGPSSCTTSNPKTFALNYGYDLAGNLAQYTNGIASILFTPQYNGAGRLSMLTSTWNDSLHPPTLFTADPINGYTAAGGIQNMILGNSIFVTKTYDNRLRTTKETATHP
jgi:YD repeat-containing protein